jgi:hypothetical protein
MSETKPKGQENQNPKQHQTLNQLHACAHTHTRVERERLRDKNKVSPDAADYTHARLINACRVRTGTRERQRSESGPGGAGGGRGRHRKDAKLWRDAKEAGNRDEERHDFPHPPDKHLRVLYQFSGPQRCLQLRTRNFPQEHTHT